METVTHNSAYQLGLLHFTHLLMNADGVVDNQEVEAVKKICYEEQISDNVFKEFQANVFNKTEKEIYNEGVALLNTCTDQEKLCAMVHLFQLSEADNSVHEKEVRLLLYSLEGTNVDFEDVALSARMVKASYENRRAVLK
jgi:uncharacterized tellurite resistance protein B-like protein